MNRLDLDVKVLNGSMGVWMKDLQVFVKSIGIFLDPHVVLVQAGPESS